jgi:hypothetical protein
VCFRTCRRCPESWFPLLLIPCLQSLHSRLPSSRILEPSSIRHDTIAHDLRRPVFPSPLVSSPNSLSLASSSSTHDTLRILWWGWIPPPPLARQTDTHVHSLHRQRQPSSGKHKHLSLPFSCSWSLGSTLGPTWSLPYTLACTAKLSSSPRARCCCCCCPRRPDPFTLFPNILSFPPSSHKRPI